MSDSFVGNYRIGDDQCRGLGDFPRSFGPLVPWRDLNGNLFLKQVRGQAFVRSALFSAKLCLVVGLIQWFGSDGRDKSGIAFAMNNVNYGLFIYFVVYLWSLRSPTESVEAGKANCIGWKSLHFWS